MNRLIVGALAIVAALALAACGDDDESPSPSPSGTASPSSTSTPEPTEPGRTLDAVAYVDLNGDIWLAPANGGDPTLFVDTGTECPNPTEIIWSPDGEHVACFGFDSATSTPAFAVYGPDADIVHSEASAISAFVWNPEGDSFAYTTESSAGGTDLTVRNVNSGDVGVSVSNAESPAWSPDGRLAVNRPGDDSATLDIYEGTDATSIPGDYRPLAWVLDGDQILVGANYSTPADDAIVTYEAFLLDPETEEATRVPELDSRAGLFWISPDGASAVFVQPQPDPPELAVIDFETLEVTPIADSRIGFPSEFIPGDHVAFASDSQTVYWADVTTGAEIYAAALDGSSPAPLATIDGAVTLEFSPDRTRVVYIQSGDPASLWVANIDGSAPLEITSPVLAYAWRLPTAD